MKHHSQQVAQGRPGQSVGHHRFDVLAATRAVVAMDHEFADHRLDVFGNIFDEPRTGTLATLQVAAAIGAAHGLMLHGLINQFRPGPTRPGMPVATARAALAAAAAIALGIHRPHARRRGGMGCGARRNSGGRPARIQCRLLGLQPGKALGHGQQGEHHRLRPQRVQAPAPASSICPRAAASMSCCLLSADGVRARMPPTYQRRTHGASCLS